MIVSKRAGHKRLWRGLRPVVRGLVYRELWSGAKLGRSRGDLFDDPLLLFWRGGFWSRIFGNRE